MQDTNYNQKEIDTFFCTIKEHAISICEKEKTLAPFLRRIILESKGFDESLSRLIASKIATEEVSAYSLYEVCMEAYNDAKYLLNYAICDINAVLTRDPASTSSLSILLFLKGPHVLETYRISHWLWQNQRFHLSYFLQSRLSEVYAVDIHPAAVIGKGLMLDHATNIVIGETAVIEDTVSLLHGVTLGGTGKEQGNRHPKIGRGVMIGAGAKILGNIRIGEGAVVGAGSVVLKDVPPHTTVVGVPARVIGKPKIDMPSLTMDQTFNGCNSDKIGTPCPAIASQTI
jgi:serine O-acetyltransferase